jgi:hypothetical protein
MPSLESGEKVPVDLGESGHVTGGGDLTKREWISVSEYSSLPAYDLVGDIESGDIITEDDIGSFPVQVSKLSWLHNTCR